MEANRYLELARREAGQARNACALCEAAEQFALQQVDEGLREHFLRVAGRAKLESVAHAARARRFEASAAIARRPADSSPLRPGREAAQATARANAELVRRMLAAALRDDFEVALEHLPARGS